MDANAKSSGPAWSGPVREFPHRYARAIGKAGNVQESHYSVANINSSQQVQDAFAGGSQLSSVKLITQLSDGIGLRWIGMNRRGDF